MVAGPIAVAYNVSGVDDLVLDAPTIAKIFDGKITNWNDAAIAKLNPDAKLPDLKIQPYHRSDESGTTDNFTKYLIAATPDNWKYEGGKAWQAKGGQSAAGSSGVAQGVKQTNGAIGYMELSYAKDGLGTVAIDTGAAAPVKASSDGATKAVAAAQVVGTGNDLSLKLDYTTKAEGATRSPWSRTRSPATRATRPRPSPPPRRSCATSPASRARASSRASTTRRSPTPSSARSAPPSRA